VVAGRGKERQGTDDLYEIARARKETPVRPHGHQPAKERSSDDRRCRGSARCNSSKLRAERRNKQ
jgi:hypothetical protein